MKQKVTPGRIVLYVLSESDASQINLRRTTRGSISQRTKTLQWPLGAQAHIGNTVEPGEIFPAIVVRIWGSGDDPAVNLQVLMDGNDTYWATARREDEGESHGTWHWPVMQGITGDLK